MQRMREVIRGSLARSLRTLAEEDRLAAALPVVCGSALSAHCSVVRLDADRTLHLLVDAPEWLHPLLGMRDRIQHDLQRVAGVPVGRVHFMEAESTAEARRRQGAAGTSAGPESAASILSTEPRRRRPA